MKEVAQLIMSYALVPALILLIIYYITQLYKDSKVLKEIGNKIKNFISSVIHFFNTFRRRRYDRALSSKKYLEFQKRILFEIYKPLIEEYNTLHKDTPIYIANLFNYEYEATFQKTKPIAFPFEGVIKKSELEYFDQTKKLKLNHFQKKYRRLIKRTVKKPKKLGYMLKNILFNNGKMKLQAYTSTYEFNLYESHILEYELYRMYKKYSIIDSDKSFVKRHEIHLSQTNNKDMLLSKLPMRNTIHEKFKKEGSECDILTSGNNRTSLLGVQAIVLCKKANSTGYDALRIRRSEDVVAKPGFLQFIPSGGFETYEDHFDFDIEYSNFSLSKAVFKEFLEECFGKNESTTELQSCESLYGTKVTKQMIQDITEGNSHFDLLGTSMSLVGLRHELSFILTIDNQDIVNQIRKNNETKSMISFIDINVLRSKSHWLQYKESSIKSDIELLNCTSAGLFNLVNQYIDENKL